jgi:hypothetical protein
MDKPIVIGQEFGRLTVVREGGLNEWQARTWICKCGCGEWKSATTAALNAGDAISCGCLSRGRARNRTAAYVRASAAARRVKADPPPADAEECKRPTT